MFIISYNPVTFARKHVVTKIKSLTWTKRFYDIGSFELHLKECPLEKNDIIKQGDNCGIVMEIQDNYPEGVTVYGYDLKGITGFRYLSTPKLYIQHSPEYIIKDLCTECMTVGNRAISGLVIAENQDRGNTMDFAVEKYLSDSLARLSKQSDMGYDIYFDERRLVLDILLPRVNNDIVFDIRRKNIKDVTYTQSLYNTYNVVYSTDDDGNTLTEGISTGILRREGYTNKSEEMSTFLSEKAEIETLTGNAAESLKYGKDYKLGDYVSVEFGGLTTTKIISEVQLNYEPNGASVCPTFGTERENPIKKILKG